MQRKLPRGLGLLTGTLLCATLTAGALLAPGRGAHGRPSAAPAGPRASENPLWRRVTAGASDLLHWKPGQALTAHAARQAMDRLGVSAWHRAGYRGQGMKVAILDSGFRGYRDALGSALPARVTVRSFRYDGNLEARESAHGILCGEVVHRLAPEAELLFANWEAERPEQFLEAVRWARAQGAQVISCSVIMPTWSDTEGGGLLHQALARELGTGSRAGDALFFASAGNTALRHWGGALRPGRDGWHQWADKCRDNLLYPFGEERVSVEVCGPAEASLEVVVRDTTTGQEVGRSATPRARASGWVVVRFDPRPKHTYAVRVRTASEAVPAPEVGRFHLVALGGRLQHVAREGSIPFPGDGPEVIAVGAVDRRGRRLAYSSCGSAANPVKPDLVAAVPFPCAWREEQPFAGTSAAAPQAAALAALVWSRRPGWSANQVGAALRAAARPPERASAPWETGHGLIHLP